MHERTVVRSCILPASKEVVFEKLQELKTLQYIASPYATFTPVEPDNNLIWREGESFSFYFKLFGFIPFGVHTIRVIEFNADRGIYTNESNPSVPVWNHRILLEQAGGDAVKYTDEVQMAAGRKTELIYLWAKLFYAHRQRKWRKLLQITKRWEK